MVSRGSRWLLALLLTGAALACATTGGGRPAAPSDAWIRAEIERRLQEEDRLRNPQTVHVQVRQGVVVLSGVLTTLDEVRRALRIARRVPGVVQVLNHVHVVGLQGQPGVALAGDLSRRLPGREAA